MIKCNNIIIAKKKVICKSIISKAIGLMFHMKPIDTGYIFIFSRELEPAYLSIHNLFVFFSIDVIFIDSKKRIVDIKEKFMPFSINYTPKKKAKYIIEFCHGTIEKNKIRIGDYIEF